MTRRHALAVVVLLFMISVICRIPFLTRPLTGEHDWLTLHSLLTLSLWNTIGLSQSHYSLVMNYPNPADKYVTYADKRATVVDQCGNTYFVAFPPFAFLFAFWTLRLFHLPTLAIYLKLITLTLLLPAVLLFYLLLDRTFSDPDGGQRSSAIAVLGTSLFLLNRAVLLSLGNLYFPITFVIPLWIFVVYFYCTAQDETTHRPLWLSLFFLFAFLASYCDWTGVAGTGACFAWSVLRKTRAPLDFLMAGLSCSASGAALLLAGLQYGSIAGFSKLANALLFRFTERAGVTAAANSNLTVWNPHTYASILHQYHVQYGGVLLVVWALVFLYLVIPRISFHLRRTTQVRRVLFLFASPVMVDHLLLANHTAVHNYAVLKAAPVLVVLFVFLVDGLLHYQSSAAPKPTQRCGILARCTVAVIILCCVSIIGYVSERSHVFPADATLGAEIRRQARRDQVVFLMRRGAADEVSPNLIYFSGRNVQMVSSDNEAMEFLERHGRRDGVLFFARPDGRLLREPQVIKAHSDGIEGWPIAFALLAGLERSGA